MLELLLFIIVFACIMSVCVRVIVTHPISTVRYAVIDLYQYFRFHRWDARVKPCLQCIRLYLCISGTMINGFLTLTVRNGLPRRYILSLMFPLLSLMRILFPCLKLWRWLIVCAPSMNRMIHVLVPLSWVMNFLFSLILGVLKAILILCS